MSKDWQFHLWTTDKHTLVVTGEDLFHQDQNYWQSRYDLENHQEEVDTINVQQVTTLSVVSYICVRLPSPLLGRTRCTTHPVNISQADTNSQAHYHSCHIRTRHCSILLWLGRWLYHQCLKSWVMTYWPLAMWRYSTITASFLSNRMFYVTINNRKSR